MAHLVWIPQNISIRRYYWNIIQTYYRTMTGLKGQLYVLKNYGIVRYLHIAKGILFITVQYLVLCAKGRL